MKLSKEKVINIENMWLCNFLKYNLR